ncbi:MAG: DUF4255 domain-containing protein [Bacteroidales bacterium]|nr:DUF4255 domain-containing protein [Bacteroidales bacterium]
MSNALAIASVTHVLKDLLNNGLIDHDVTGATGGNVNVTALPPDRIDITETGQSQLNLFMYRATPNLGWSNVGFPSLNSQGERIANPPLPIDLHYLLTAYGVNELHSEILLGYGMQLLHETPALGRDAIRTSLAPPSSVSGVGLPPELQALSTSELAEQVEQIKIVPEILSTEEISKLWAAFGAKYRPTAAYLVSVVLIESKKSTKSALPVKERMIYVLPFRKPEIENIFSQKDSSSPIVENQKILSEYNIVLKGKQLQGEFVEINISGYFVSPNINDIDDKQIIVQLPSSLPAGIQGAQVIHQNYMGSPPEPHRGVESNVAAFVLSPFIETKIVTNVQGTGDDLRSADIKLTVKPAIGETQRVILLMNEIKPDIVSPPDTSPPLSYSFQAPSMALLSPPAPTENITIHISGVKAGTYLIRIQVDGAESPLETDASGKYDEPQVTIP